MPAAVLLSRFHHHYPGMYRSPAYRTADQTIPFGLFWILHSTMTHNLALDRVNQAAAISHALGNAFAGKENASAAKEATRKELAEAFLGVKD